MRLGKILFVLLLAFFLMSCESNNEIVEEVILELIGDETVEIEEGTEYEDLGVLLNGEKVDFIGYYSNINIDRVGTYYVKYEYKSVEILRTVKVIEGARTNLLAIILEFENSTNYSYTLDLDVHFTRGGVDFHTFIYEDYDVNEDYMFGLEKRTSYNMIEYSQNAYIYLDIANNIEEHYMFDEYSFWYQDRMYYSRQASNVTDFNLSGIRSVTKEDKDGQTVYTGYLNFEDYMIAYNSKINLIPDENFDFETDDYITIIITVEDDQIVRIESDLLYVMRNTISDSSNAIPNEYKYVYTFSNYNQVEEIIIPEEGVQARRLVHPDFMGSGTVEDPYIVMDITQFQLIGDNLDKHFKLGVDIDLSEYSWMPFGMFKDMIGQPYSFSGTLDGNGHSINNMSTHGQLSMEYYGLFLCIDGGSIKNLSFNNVDIHLSETNISFTGGVLAAEILAGSITDVSINGTMRARIEIIDGYSFVKIGSLTGALSDGVTLEGNSYDVDITLITNLLDTNYSVHEVAGTGSEFVTIYDSTTTITIEEIE